jgi:methionyl-tRNA formyltransferase
MICLLTRHNSYVGREYADSLIQSGLKFVVAAFGDHPPIERMEEIRCGGHWKPLEIEKIGVARKVERFASITDPRFHEFIRKNEYQFAIQGDIGEIAGRSFLNLFPNGIINFHPGDLPEYRGCNAPEWQILEGNSVICTAHLLDEGIDTGPIIKKKELALKYESYSKMRASVYPAVGKFVAELSTELISQRRIRAIPQGSGNHRRRMPHEILEKVCQAIREIEDR